MDVDVHVQFMSIIFSKSIVLLSVQLYKLSGDV